MNIAPPPQADGHQHTDDAPLVHVMMEQQHLSPAMLRVAAATTFDGLRTNAALHPISCPPGTTTAILEQLGLAVTAAINVAVDQHNGSGGKPCRHNNVIHPPPPIAASSASAAAGSGAAIRERYSAMMMAPHEPTSHHFEHHHHQEQQEQQEHHEHHSPLRSGLAAIRTMHDDHLKELDDQSSPQPPQDHHQQHAPRHRQFLVDCLGEHEPSQSCPTTSSPTPSTPTKVSGNHLAHRSLLPPITTSPATHPPGNRATTLSPPPPLTAVDETHPQKHYSLLPRLASMSLPSKQQVGPVIAALDRDEVDHLLLEIVDLIATYRQRSSVVVMSHSNETPLTSQSRPQSTSTKHRRVKPIHQLTMDSSPFNSAVSGGGNVVSKSADPHNLQSAITMNMSRHSSTLTAPSTPSRKIRPRHSLALLQRDIDTILRSNTTPALLPPLQLLMQQQQQPTVDLMMGVGSTSSEGVVERTVSDQTSLNTSQTSCAVATAGGGEEGRSTPKVTDHVEHVTDAEGFTTINDYVVLEQAGAGRYGKVVIASVGGTSELRAIKIVPKSRLRRRWQQMISAAPLLSEPDTSVRAVNLDAATAVAESRTGVAHNEPMVFVVPRTDTDTAAQRTAEQRPTSLQDEDNEALIDFNPGSQSYRIEDRYTIALQREVAIMKRIRHKNVVPLFEVIDDPHEQAMYLVMKYIEKGPIVHLDATWSCPPLDIDMVRCITRQIASGVSYLHRHHIAHRDIKPDNILLGADGVVYLSDFGVSQIFENDDRVTNSDGTPAYAAPEIVRGTEGYSAMKADIWALGVTVYTLVFGCAPFIALSIFELNEKIAQQPVDYSIRGEMSRDDDFDDVIDLLRRMLERDAEKRITAAEVCQHRFIYRRKRSSPDPAIGGSSTHPHGHHHHHHPHLHRDSLSNVSKLSTAKPSGSESGGDSSEGLTSSTSVDVTAHSARSSSPPPQPSVPMCDLITEEEVMAAFTLCR